MAASANSVCVNAELCYKAVRDVDYKSAIERQFIHHLPFFSCKCIFCFSQDDYVFMAVSFHFNIHPTVDGAPLISRNLTLSEFILSTSKDCVTQVSNKKRNKYQHYNCLNKRNMTCGLIRSSNIRCLSSKAILVSYLQTLTLISQHNIDLFSLTDTWLCNEEYVSLIESTPPIPT